MLGVKNVGNRRKKIPSKDSSSSKHSDIEIIVESSENTMDSEKSAEKLTDPQPEVLIEKPTEKSLEESTQSLLLFKCDQCLYKMQLKRGLLSIKE